MLSLACSVETISYDKHSVFTACNSDCFCSASDWDPVCGEDGITYVSPCLAGCTSSAGTGKNTVSCQVITNIMHGKCIYGFKTHSSARAAVLALCAVKDTVDAIKRCC